MYIGRQGFAGVYMGVHRNTGVNRGIQGFIVVYMGQQRNKGVYRSIQGCT